jgi:hypothetical protein
MNFRAKSITRNSPHYRIGRRTCYFFLILVNLAWSSEALTIVVPPWGFTPSNHDTYFAKLLSLAFVKTAATDGHAIVETSSKTLSNARVMADLKNGITFEVAWNGINAQRERDLLPIRIPLLKELSEYRVLMIRKEDQQKFSSVRSLEELRSFTAGSGTDWTSTEILKENGLPVVVVNRSSVLFSMLKAKRFDYISRNMFEAWEEETFYQKDGLVIENTLLLHSGVPYYFFVNKNNKALADRIERGLKIAIADGSFDDLFFSTPGFKRGSEEIKAGKRRLIELTKN